MYTARRTGPCTVNMFTFTVFTTFMNREHRERERVHDVHDFVHDVHDFITRPRGGESWRNIYDGGPLHRMGEFPTGESTSRSAFDPKNRWIFPGWISELKSGSLSGPFYPGFTWIVVYCTRFLYKVFTAYTTFAQPCTCSRLWCSRF